MVFIKIIVISERTKKSFIYYQTFMWRNKVLFYKLVFEGDGGSFFTGWDCQFFRNGFVSLNRVYVGFSCFVCFENQV